MAMTTHTYPPTPLLKRAADARGLTILEYQRLCRRWRLRDIGARIETIEASREGATEPHAPFMSAWYEDRLRPLREEAAGIERELSGEMQP